WQLAAEGHDDDLFHNPALKQSLSFGKCRVEIERNQSACFSVADLSDELWDRVKRVAAHHGSARLQNCVIVNDEGWAIREEQRHACALAHAELDEPFCSAVGLADKLSIGHCLSEKAGCWSLSETRGGLIEKRR